MIVLIFSLTKFHVAWKVFFTLLTQEKIQYDAKFSTEEKIWQF